MSKKLGKLTDLLVYLEEKEKRLFLAIQSLCAGGLLIPCGKEKGLTLMLPLDKQEVEKFVNAADSDEEFALQTLKSWILRVGLPDPLSFAKVKEDLPNKLGQKVPVRSINRQYVILGNGGKLVPVSEFNKAKSNVYIYHYTGPPIGLDGEKSELGHFSTVSGGGVSEEARVMSIFNDIIDKQCHIIKRCAGDINNQSEDLFAEMALSFNFWYEMKYPDEYYNKHFIRLTCFPAIDFFLGVPMLHHTIDRRILEWYEDTRGAYMSDHRNIMKAYVSQYDTHCAEYWRRRGLDENKEHKRAADIRAELLRNPWRHTLRQAVKDAYEQSNLPGTAIEKAWVDDARFTMYQCWEKCIGSNPGGCNVQSFMEYVTTIKCILVTTSNFDDLFTMGSYKSSDATPYLGGLLAWIRSNAFLWQPTSSGVTGHGLPNMTFLNSSNTADTALWDFAGKVKGILNSIDIPARIPMQAISMFKGVRGITTESTEPQVDESY